MGKVKFIKISYRGNKILLGYSAYENFQWYVGKINGYIVICFNKNINRMLKAKILHRVLKDLKNKISFPHYSHKSVENL